MGFHHQQNWIWPTKRWVRQHISFSNGSPLGGGKLGWFSATAPGRSHGVLGYKLSELKINCGFGLIINIFRSQLWSVYNKLYPIEYPNEINRYIFLLSIGWITQVLYIIIYTYLYIYMIDTRCYQFMKSQKQGSSYFFKQPTVWRRTKTIKNKNKGSQPK